MGGQGNRFDAGTGAVSWQDRLICNAAQFKSVLARALSVEESTKSLRFYRVKETEEALCLRVEANGQSLFFKLFDGVGTRDVYSREKETLQTLRSSGLVPRLIDHSDQFQFVLTEWLNTPLDLGRDDPCDVAYRLGQWRARFDAATPWQPACGNWFGYLKTDAASLESARIKEGRAQLMQIPLCGLGVAQNDRALNNFRSTPAGQIVGCDFKRSEIRPRGWDYLGTYQALVERFGGAKEQDLTGVLAALSRGFDQAHRGALITEELDTVARLLFSTR